MFDEISEERPSDGTAIGLADGLDSNSIIEMQAVLLGDQHPEWVGKWRDRQVWIGGRRYGPHESLFTPPHPDRVPAATDVLVAFAGRDDIQALVHAAVVHAQFETIHPFPGGNGRTGAPSFARCFAAAGSPETSPSRSRPGCSATSAQTSTRSVIVGSGTFPVRSLPAEHRRGVDIDRVDGRDCDQSSSVSMSSCTSSMAPSLASWPMTEKPGTRAPDITSTRQSSRSGISREVDHRSRRRSDRRFG
jgi:hypothetical protein